MGEEQQQSRRSNSRAATSLAGGFLRDSQAEGCRKRTTEERQGPEAAVKVSLLFEKENRRVDSNRAINIIFFTPTHPQTRGLDWIRRRRQMPLTGKGVQNNGILSGGYRRTVLPTGFQCSVSP